MSTKIPGNDGNASHTADHNHNVYRQLRSASDPIDKATEYSDQVWMSQHGEAIVLAENNFTAAEERAQDAEAEAAEAEANVSKMERYEIGVTKQDEGDHVTHETVAFSQWAPHDKGVVILMALAAFILLLLGGVNVVLVVLASEIPAFIDNPILAYLLAGIVPAMSMALKSGYSLCRLDRDRHRYAVCVFILAAVSSFVWVVLFTLSFKGSSGGGDIGTILVDISSGTTGPDYSAARNIAQIMAEILLGAALFLNIDRVFARYSPYHITEKVGLREMTDDAAELRAKADLLRDIATDAQGAFAQLKAARRAFIIEAVAALTDK